MTIEDFHQLWTADRHAMLERGHVYCAELRTQEEQIREILPALRGAFRMDRAARPEVNDNARTQH